MRRILLAAAMTLGIAQGALAADLPILRGGFVDDYRGPALVDWQGFYIGGHGGTGNASMDFSGASRTVISRLLAYTEIENEMSVSRWPLMGKVSPRVNGYGGFVGYNSQWDDVVIGVEANYMHGRFGGSSAGSMARRFTVSSGDTYDINAAAAAAMDISDIVTLRARAGYAVGAFLPYMFGGVALGYADIVRGASITGTVTDSNDVTNPLQPLAAVDSQKSRLLYGYSAGLGVDVNLIAGLFARAEWEYMRLTGPVDTAINTVRAGLGYKF